MKKLLDKIIHSAWEPLTPRGVAAFSRASLARLLFVQLLFATLTVITVVWFLLVAWFPVVREAIRQMPADSRIYNAQLVWRGDSPMRLAGNHFLSFAVDSWHEHTLSREAQIAVEFSRKDIRIHSLLGYVECAYPQGYAIAANQMELEPWWGAWQPWLLAITAIATALGLLIIWAVLATVYSLIVWLIAFFTNRSLNWVGSWKLAGTALMPGALFMTLTIVAYGFGLFDLVQLGMGFVFHFLISWIYMAVSPVLLPRDPGVAKPKRNPFTPA